MWTLICVDGRWDGTKQSIQYLHRFLMQPEPGQKVDHINHDTLDDTRGNLRFANSSQNGANRSLAKNNHSGYIGVLPTESGRFVARLGRKHLGTHDTAEEAAHVRDAAALDAYGVFAYLNFPEPAVQIAQAA